MFLYLFILCQLQVIILFNELAVPIEKYRKSCNAFLISIKQRKSQPHGDLIVLMCLDHSCYRKCTGKRQGSAQKHNRSTWKYAYVYALMKHSPNTCNYANVYIMLMKYNRHTCNYANVYMLMKHSCNTCNYANVYMFRLK